MPIKQPEHTARFLMKVLWKYKGAKSRKEILIRLLEYDCIRRNWTKGTLINLLYSFRAWLKDPESRCALKLGKEYRQILEEFKNNEHNMQNIEEDIQNEETVIKEETMDANTNNDCISEPELNIQNEINKLEEKKEMLRGKYSKVSIEIGAQSRILSIKLGAITEAFNEECSKIDEQIQILYKQQALQELMK